MKVQEDLDRLREDKSELEAELRARNEEIYQLNEKLMMLEIN
jgi:predicted nuclease with TOPRIM domain